jgi:hypothetical protein
MQKALGQFSVRQVKRPQEVTGVWRKSNAFGCSDLAGFGAICQLLLNGISVISQLRQRPVRTACLNK